MHNQKQFFNCRSELRAVLSKGRYTTLALTDGNDSYILTLSYGLDEDEDILYFHCSTEGTKIDFFKSNPYLCGTVIQDDGYQHGKCNHYYHSVVYYGLLEVIHKTDEKMKALRCMFAQLEDNPEQWTKPYEAKPEALSDVLIMKLSIDEMNGKRNPG
ncbi:MULTISPECIES: pyridoxamine 5'-phosphate oxidase family protein [unclassified Oceanispirochaeta]|uniref:pyridoxamine 5'-phosphate oxidase family protein n=1 Tax=unclassified Oceanispirochaeta TaxID=2635722 RepID=UPI0011C05FE7|nr:MULTISPECIES: pyridoxamine 5'-phosphate oxidase family protein [unclassified Oceanispirochaeta]MBF9015617.1 pyridoxamine 5'-phosphate oxidase family protein [Oceanispirochaeta sp. M2]NPD73391.1 hypothetical protein [Oceanispirochaeta sp. M1]